MLITGAKGFAKQLLEVMDQLNYLDQVVLFDDVAKPQMNHMYERFRILHSEAEVLEEFQRDRRFVLGTGGPNTRHKAAQRFRALGGSIQTIISPAALVSRFSIEIGAGASILSNAVIEGNTKIGEGALINVGTIITHDCVVGAFSEICPAVRICGNSKVGSFTTIGTGAVIIPNIEVGTGVVIAAGSVVTRNIPDNVMVAGVPAVIKKKI